MLEWNSGDLDERAVAETKIASKVTDNNSGGHIARYIQDPGSMVDHPNPDVDGSWPEIRLKL